jgi:hypothetical protein
MDVIELLCGCALKIISVFDTSSLFCIFTTVPSEKNIFFSWTATADLSVEDVSNLIMLFD